MTEAIKSILFATDGSEYSAGALRLAIDMAKRCEAQMTAMTIALGYQDLGGVVGAGNLREVLEQQAQARLDDVVRTAQAAGVECGTLLAYGDSPDEEIIRAAANLGVDMIVMGRRGKRGLDRYNVGHATGRVAGQAECNVLVVPRAAGMWSSRILVATDGSAHGKSAAMMAKEAAQQCNLPVLVVSAVSSSHSESRRQELKGAVDAIVEELVQAGIGAEGKLLEGRPDEVVVETAQAEKADLIIVGSHGRTGLSKLLLGSVSERIIGQSYCPVLVARGE